MKYLILISTVFIAFSSYSQNKKTKTITTSYNRKSKEIRDLNSDYIGFNKNLEIKMDSVNPVLYKVVYKFKDFVWYSETPESIAKILPGMDPLIYNSEEKKTDKKGGEIIDSILVKKPIMERLDSISSLINRTKIRTSKKDVVDTLFLKNTLDSIASYLKPELAGNTKATGKEIINTLTYHIDSLGITYQFELDHIKLEGLPNGYTEKTIAHLTRVKTNQEKLNKVKPIILNGTQAIIYGLKKPGNSNTSKLHLPKKEAVTVNIFVLDRFSPKDTLSTYSTDIYKTGKFKLDFSVGIGGNSLIDPVFYIDNKDSIPFIATENKREIDLTAYSLIHFNWRIKSCLSGGPLTGISISIINAKPSYLLGGGLTVGKEKTISFSGGASFGELELLSNRISSDGYTNDQPLQTNISEVPTYKRMSVGYFFAVTYNFGRVKK